MPLPRTLCFAVVGADEAESGNRAACRRNAPPGFRAAPRAVFAVTAIRLQSLTHLRACSAAHFVCLQGIGARPIPAARSLVPLRERRTGLRRIGHGNTHRNGQGAGLRPGLLRQVVQMRAVLNAGGSSPPRHDRRFPDTPPSLAMELPHHASSMPPQDAAGSFALSVEMIGLVSIKGQIGEAVLLDCRVGPISLRSSRPMRPWLVVNPGGGTAAPWASWPQPSGANNFPCAVTAFGAFLAGQILCDSRSSTAFRPQAVRPAHPPPAGSQQGRDGRDLG